MKTRYQYRIYLNHLQVVKLNQLFGCCRFLWNQALSDCNKLYSQKEKKPGNSDLQKQFITQAKKSNTCLKEVASTPLHGRSLNDLDIAYKNFFDILSGKRKEPKLKALKFKSRKSRQSARFVGGNFQVGKYKIKLTKDRESQDCLVTSTT